MESIHNYLIYLRMQHCRKALEEGVCFDGSSIAGFMHVEEATLYCGRIFPP